MTTSMAVRTATRTLSSAQLQRTASALLRSAASRQLASCRKAPAVISRSTSAQRAVSRALSGSVAASFDVGTLLRNSSVLGIRNASDAAEETVNVPGMGDSISEGSIATWNKKVGEYVEADEVIAVVDTDKVSVDILCPVSGVLQKVEANEGDTVFVGDPFYTILVTDDRSLASGPSDNAGDDAAEETEESAGSPANARKETVVPMSRMRQSIAKRLKGAQEDAAALSTFNEVDMSGLMALRSELGEAFKATHGCKLGFMSPFIIACAKALQRFPDVNASIMNKKEIEYRNYVDISVAVATPTGLMVPVIRDCHTKSFADLEKELLELAGRAREGQIKMDEMAGGTFTISNGGIYGSMMGTPLLNPPQSAILGMHTITPRPVAVKGKIEIRPMMYLALTYDHQIVDGREAVSFLKMVKELLEDPRRMLLEV